MKTIRYSFIPLLFLFLFQHTAKAQWNTLSISTGTDLSNLSFPSDDTGYVSSLKIYRTFNGGSSFDSVSVPGFSQYNSIHFRTNSEGVVCGSTSSGNSIYRTFNSGTSWIDISPASSVGSPVNVKFADALNGTFLTSNYIFYRTFNGGITWDTISFGYDYFNTIDFPTSTTGYIGGFDGTFAYRGVICKTVDGGATWSVITAMTQWNSIIQQIQFVNADTGFASYNPFSLPSCLIRTHNGGALWDTVHFLSGQIVSFDFSNANDGFVVNDSGSIYRTSDGGVSWQLDRLHTNYLTDICVTPSFAYSTGLSGLLIKRNLSTGIPGQFSANDVHLFPNPGNDLVTLQLSSDFEIVNVNAFDVTGKNCGEIPFTNSSTGEIQLDTHALSSGWYVLEIKGETGIVTVKFGKI